MSDDVCRSGRALAFAAEAVMDQAVGSGQFRNCKAEIPVDHTFWGGVYARRITVPAGVILTGEVHKYDNMNMLVSGTMRFVVDDNNAVEIVGPKLICAPSGVKRLAYAVTECVWITFLPTPETDPVVIERLFIAKTEEEYQNFLRLERAERQGCLS